MCAGEENEKKTQVFKKECLNKQGLKKQGKRSNKTL